MQVVEFTIILAVEPKLYQIKTSGFYDIFHDTGYKIVIAKQYILPVLKTVNQEHLEQK